MDFKLTPLVEVLKMTKELKDAALAPIRVMRAKARFDGAMAEMQEKLMNAQTKIPEMCQEADIKVDRLLDSLDEIALMERRIAQIEEIKSQLFPS